MKLSSFDGAMVRITDDCGSVFEGECSWLPPEYCFAELGREEEALQIDDWVFYAGTIRSVERIEDRPLLIWQGRTEHRMRLDDGPFRAVESGRKTIELRLYDEKRRLLRVGDVIRFESKSDDTEAVRAVVKRLHVFPDFAALYASLPLIACGYTPEEAAGASPRDMERWYSPADQARWGVVGIELELI